MWQAHVNSTTHQYYPDSTCGSFEVKEMISWRLRRMIRRRTERIQRKLARIHSMLDPMTPLPPPEPPPIWDNGWSWDVRYNWYYIILEPTDEPIEDPLKVPSLEEEKRLKDWKWRQVVSSFVSTHNPATIMQFVSDVFEARGSNKLSEYVGINTVPRRRFCQDDTSASAKEYVGINTVPRRRFCQDDTSASAKLEVTVDLLDQ